MQQTVTIGIPLYRAVQYIEAALTSALSQTYEYIEVLVVDDQGGDGSMQVVERLRRDHPRGHCIRVLHNDSNLGVGPSRNRIISEARGGWLYFLDSDDTMAAEAIALLHDRATAAHADVAYGSMQRQQLGQTALAMSYHYPDLVLKGPDALASHVFSHHGAFQSSVCNVLISLPFLRGTTLRFGHARFWEDTSFTYAMVLLVGTAVLDSHHTYCYRERLYSLSNYQERPQLSKDEVMGNAATVNTMKLRYATLADKHFIGDYCYTMQSYSFYIVSYALQHSRRIVPRMTATELHSILRFPMPLRAVRRFPTRRKPCLALWLLAAMPFPLQAVAIRLLATMKRLRQRL